MTNFNLTIKKRFMDGIIYGSIYRCIWLLNLSFLFTNAQNNINGNFFGINAWMPAASGTSVTLNLNGHAFGSNLGGHFENFVTNTNTRPHIASLKMKFMRFGGTQSDINTPTLSDYTLFINRCQSVGAIPIIQIPIFNCWYFNSTTPANVLFASQTYTYTYLQYFASMVTTLVSPPYNVRHFAIGNEPDRYTSAYGSAYTSTNTGSPDGLDAKEIALYFKEASKQIKVAAFAAGVNNVVVMGPDLSFAHSHSNGLAEKLMTGTSAENITGLIPGIPQTAYYCDIFAFHAYGFPACAANPCTTFVHDRANVITQPSTDGTHYPSFQTQINTIRTHAANSQNPNLQIAVTELNITHVNQSSNGVGDVSCHSFIAGQWLSEIFSKGLHSNTSPIQTSFMLPWSLHEGAGGRGSGDLGIIDGSFATNSSTSSSFLGRSTYHHLKLMTNNFDRPHLFSNTYFYPGDFANGGNQPTNVKVFGSTTCGRNIVVIINQNQGGSALPVSITLGSNATTGTKAVRVNMNFPSTNSFPQFEDNTGIASEETIFYEFNSGGQPVSITKYNVGNSVPQTQNLGSNPIFECNYKLARNGVSISFFSE